MCKDELGSVWAYADKTEKCGAGNLGKKVLCKRGKCITFLQLHSLQYIIQFRSCFTIQTVNLKTNLAPSSERINGLAVLPTLKQMMVCATMNSVKNIQAQEHGNRVV